MQLQTPQAGQSTTSSLDPTIVNLAKAIRQSESGGNFTVKGKSGEYGAYQYTPDTWKQDSQKFLGQPTELTSATPEQQNEVAYKKIADLKSQGYNVGQIASVWNSGDSEAYTGKFSNGKPATGVNKFGVKYDVPAYAKSVATAYQTLKNGGKVGTDPNNPSSTNKKLTFDDITTNNTAQGSDTNLQVDNAGSSALSRPMALEQGLGYALSNAMGTQDQVIGAQNRGEDTRTQLLQRIKEKKANGEDTTRLQKALNQLGSDLHNSAQGISDVGTGGITNNQVLASAGEHAAVAATAYGGGLIKQALQQKALADPVISKILQSSVMPGETITRDGAISRLTAYLGNMSASEVGGSTEQSILKALKELNPTLVEKQGILTRLIKGGFDLATKGALIKFLGDTVGSFAHQTITK